MTEHTATDDCNCQSSGLAGGTENGGPFVDAVFDALADWRRREVVEYFLDTDGSTATIEELALFLAAYEPDGSGGGSRPYDELVHALTQTHLPRLESTGVLDFDRRSGTVRYEGQATVEKWIEHINAVTEHETV